MWFYSSCHIYSPASHQIAPSKWCPYNDSEVKKLALFQRCGVSYVYSLNINSSSTKSVYLEKLTWLEIPEQFQEMTLLLYFQMHISADKANNI